MLVSSLRVGDTWTGSVACSYEAIEQMQKGVLAIEAIFREEGMTVSEEDMRREAQKTIEEAKEAKEDLDEEKLMEQIYEVLKVHLRLSDLRNVLSARQLRSWGMLKLIGGVCVTSSSMNCSLDRVYELCVAAQSPSICAMLEHPPESGV